MGTNYIPSADGDFDTWLLNFVTYAVANATALKIAVDDATELTGLQGIWATDYAGWVAAKDAAASAVLRKDARRKNAETFVRKIVRQLQASPDVPDETRRLLGITVRDTTPTTVGAPTSRPVLQADTRDPGRITVSFTDEGTPTKKAKPAGVVACLLQYKLGGTAPVADADWQFLAVDSATPYLAVFDSAAAGTALWLRGAWMNTHQEKGPFSSVLATRVPG